VYGVTTCALIALSLAAAWSDLSTRRIPNRLTAPGLAVGLVLRAITAAQAGSALPFLSGIAAVLLVFGIAFPLFMLQGLGGGDVKLLLAVAAFLGLERLGPALLVSAVVGGAMGIAAAARSGRLLDTISGAGGLVLYGVTLGRLGARPDPTRSLAIPYGVAIAAGTVAAWLV
jgi:prepilin peptidase CpaA